MSSRASRRNDITDIIKKIQNDNRRDRGLARQAYSGLASAEYGSSTSSSSGGSGSGDTSFDPAGLLKTSGDTMVGPLAFYPATDTIVDDYLSVSQGQGFSSRLYVIGEGSVADNLEVIIGPIHAGQILFFQPIIGAITLQDKTKAGTAWADTTAYVAGDVRVSGSVRYVCHTAHTSATATNKPESGSDWESFWYRNNIRITGADDREVTVDEIVLLQYDTTDGVWTMISGVGVGGGVALSDDNVWTGTNTFNGTATSINSATINFGDSAGDLINFVATVSTPGIPMGGNDIKNVGQIEFSTTSQYIKGNSVGLEYRLPVGDTHEFFINGVSELLIEGTGTTLGGDLDLATNDIQNVDQVNFEVTGQRLNSTSSSIQYEVPSGDYHNFLVNSSSEMTIRNTGVTITNDLTVSDNVTLGSSSADLTTHNGLVNYATNYSAVSQPSGASTGYITILIGGVAKKLYYY